MFRRKRSAEDFAEDIKMHLELEADELQGEGLSEDESRWKARRKKLAPRQCHKLAVVHQREMQKGNRHRATLAVARKMVAYLLAVNRQQRDFVPAGERRAGTA